MIAYKPEVCVLRADLTDAANQLIEAQRLSRSLGPLFGYEGAAKRRLAEAAEDGPIRVPVAGSFCIVIRPESE